MQGQCVRDQKIDPKKYYPADVYRKPEQVWPKDFKIDIKKMIGEKMAKQIEAKAEQVIDKLGKVLKGK
ncbi:MAG TPA: hypothetical protein DCP92_20530 [Nitrospiraceae bacterium]|nr:hypothetical protein [Nitrospiraceae bacterium]